MKKKEKRGENPKRHLRDISVSLSDWVSFELIQTIFLNYSHETTTSLKTDWIFNNNNESLNLYVLLWYSEVFLLIILMVY